MNQIVLARFHEDATTAEGTEIARIKKATGERDSEDELTLKRVGNQGPVVLAPSMLP